MSNWSNRLINDAIYDVDFLQEYKNHWLQIESIQNFNELKNELNK